MLRCLGGFVVTQQYGIGRGTSDIDFLSVSAISAEDNLESLGGLGSTLHKKHRVYVQYVGIATPPYDYADRLQVMFPEASWSKLRLFALDPQDLALSKLERNSDRDREEGEKRGLLPGRYPHLARTARCHSETRLCEGVRPRCPLSASSPRTRITHR